MVSFTADGIQTGDDVAQALAEGELGEGEGQKLIATGEPTRPMIPAVTTDAGVEFMTGQVVHQLGKDKLTGQH